MAGAGSSGRRLEKEWQWHRERVVVRARQGCAGATWAHWCSGYGSSGLGSVDGGSGSERQEAGRENNMNLKRLPLLLLL